MLLFSATLPRKVERLVTQVMDTPLRICVGVAGVANEDVKQQVRPEFCNYGLSLGCLRLRVSFIVLMFQSQSARSSVRSVC